MLAKSVKLPNLLLLFPTGVQSLWSNYNPLLLSNTALWNLMWTSGPLLTTHQLNIQVFMLKSKNMQKFFRKYSREIFKINMSFFVLLKRFFKFSVFYVSILSTTSYIVHWSAAPEEPVFTTHSVKIFW